MSTAKTLMRHEYRRCRIHPWPHFTQFHLRKSLPPDSSLVDAAIAALNNLKKCGCGILNRYFFADSMQPSLHITTVRNIEHIFVFSDLFVWFER